VPGCRGNAPWIKIIFGWRLAKQVQLRCNEAKSPNSPPPGDQQ